MAELLCFTLTISLALERSIKAAKVRKWLCASLKEMPVALSDQGLIIIRLPLAQESVSLIVCIYVLDLHLGPTLQHTCSPLQTLHFFKANFLLVAHRFGQRFS